MNVMLARAWLEPAVDSQEAGDVLGRDVAARRPDISTSPGPPRGADAGGADRQLGGSRTICWLLGAQPLAPEGRPEPHREKGGRAARGGGRPRPRRRSRPARRGAGASRGQRARSGQGPGRSGPGGRGGHRPRPRTRPSQPPATAGARAGRARSNAANNARAMRSPTRGRGRTRAAAGGQDARLVRMPLGREERAGPGCAPRSRFGRGRARRAQVRPGPPRVPRPSPILRH